MGQGAAKTLWTAPFLASGTSISVLCNGVVADVPVEQLRIGDRVLTTGGSHKTITWLGRHVVDLTRHPQALEPIRIRANALGAGQPARDLYLSPSQPIGVTIVEEALIPAAALVNGFTIARFEINEIIYWQVGLDEQDMLIAENVPCESVYLPGSRTFFEASTIPAFGAYQEGGDFGRHCRPCYAEGLFAEFARNRLIDRMKHAGWYLDRPPMSDVHLIVDRVRVEAQVGDLALSFAVPAGAENVWLVSPSSQPSIVVEGSDDTRVLGLCLLYLIIDDGIGDPRTIPACDPRLTIGFHDPEDGVRRWTTDRAALPADLWTGIPGCFRLDVKLFVPLLPSWKAPPCR